MAAEDKDKVKGEKSHAETELEMTERLKSWLPEKDGVWMFPTFWEMQDQVKALEIHEGDVWIVTFPKSGTTWMQELTWLLTHDLDFEGAKTLLKYRSPGIESCWSKKFFGMPGITLDDFRRFAAMSGGRRVLKTHLQWNILPEKHRDPDTPAKIIYVARNPKDVCVSFYYFHCLYKDMTRSLDDFCQNFMTGRYTCGPYWRHVKTFWSRRHDKNILFVKYEDMKKDLEAIICKVATFLDVPIPNTVQMKLLLDHLSFEKMKDNPALNRVKGEDKLHNESRAQDGNFIRKGIVGDWKQKMTPERAKQFDEWIKENLQDTDLSFDDS